MLYVYPDNAAFYKMLILHYPIPLAITLDFLAVFGQRG